MFVDASALVAILVREPEASELERKLRKPGPRFTSAVALLEATMALCRILEVEPLDAKASVDRLLDLAGIDIAPIGARECDLAVLAHHRFGRGRHPARLNLGDSLAYGCASALGEAILFKGNDFRSTDAAIA